MRQYHSPDDATAAAFYDSLMSRYFWWPPDTIYSGHCPLDRQKKLWYRKDDDAMRAI